MTEAEWMACEDPQKMLEFLRSKASERKLRLFAVACCRCVWDLLESSSSQKAVLVVEQFADGLTTAAILSAAEWDAWSVVEDAPHGSVHPQFAAAGAAYMAASRKAHDAAWTTADELGDVTSCDKSAQAELLRHIFGNPFRPHPGVVQWPSTVIQLANALYNGEDCGFVLHDALLDAGHLDLADHFHNDQAHPKGCWVVDLLLRKE